MASSAGAVTQDLFSEDEWALRVELAALYRAVERFGLSDLIYNHITVKVPGAEEHFLINPFGLHYSEITASSLYKIDLAGNVIFEPPGFAQFGINPAGYTIHSAVHGARPDLACVVHTHSRAGMAFSATNEVLEPVTQYGMLLYGHVSYHDYGRPARPEEGEAMVRSLGQKNIMVLRNHGLLMCGSTIPAAFLATYWMEQACKVHIELASTRMKPIPVDDDIATSLASAFPLQDGRPEWAAVKRLLDRDDPGYAV